MVNSVLVSKKMSLCKVEKFGVYMIIFGLVVYFLGFYINVTSKQNTLLYLLVLAPWVLLLPLRFKVLVPKNHLVLAIIGMLLYFSASTLWSSYSAASFGQVAKYALYLFAFMSSIYWLVSALGHKTDLIPKVVLFVGLFLLVVTAAYYFISYGQDFFAVFSERRFTAVSLVDMDSRRNPISSAALFGLSFLGLIWSVKTLKSNWMIAVALLVGCLLVFAMLMTKSRGPLLALLATITLYTVLYLRTKPVIIFAGMGVFLLLLLPFMGSIQERFSQNNYRMEIWQNSIESVGDKYIFGLGLAYEDVEIFYHDGPIEYTASHSHSFLVDAFRTGGIVGLALIVGILFKVGFGGVFSKDETTRFCAFWLLYGCICLMSNGQLLIYRPSISWLLFWIPLFLCLFLLIREPEGENKEVFPLAG